MERKITIEKEGLYEEDYQMRMLKVNTLQGILPVRGRGVGEQSFYDYNVSGKVSFKAIYEKSLIKGEEIRQFLTQLRQVIREVEEYLLNIHCILLDPEYIYYEDGNYYFCYYPPAEQDLWEAFHKLTEYFVNRADYQDKDGVRMIFLLHKETMRENYSLEKLIAQCVQVPEEEEKKESHYDSEEHDWITEQEMGSDILRETDHMWTPVKRFLGRHRRPKWGDWDGLYIEEEEL